MPRMIDPGSAEIIFHFFKINFQQLQSLTLFSFLAYFSFLTLCFSISLFMSFCLVLFLLLEHSLLPFLLLYSPRGRKQIDSRKIQPRYEINIILKMNAFEKEREELVERKIMKSEKKTGDCKCILQILVI